MSYSKVRELTRIATPGTDADLAEMTTVMTASQTARFARACHRCGQDHDEGPRAPRRTLKWRFAEDNGEMSLTVCLPPADGAVVLQALRAATGDLDHPHDGPASPGQDLTTGTWPQEFSVAAGDLADALVEVSANYLRGKITSADNADIYQVILHTTPFPRERRPGRRPAFPRERGRCSVTCPGGSPAG